MTTASVAKLFLPSNGGAREIKGKNETIRYSQSCKSRIN